LICSLVSTHKRKGEILSLKEEVIHYEKASVTDALTGLLNRRGGEESINKHMARLRRTKASFSIIILDIDHFKSINDKYGHAIGDAVISGVGKVIQTSLRESDFAVRWGGEEFLICLPDTTLAGAIMVAEKLKDAIEIMDFGICGATASFGCAEVGDDDIEVVIARADMHLYIAKSRGRNCIFPRADDFFLGTDNV